LVSTGGSSLASVEGVREAGMEVAGVLAIFSYGLESAEQGFRSAGVSFDALVSLGDLLEAAHDRGLLDAESADTIKDWRRDPYAWSAAREP
jgi:orotate phosphoribosyltransferase